MDERSRQELHGALDATGTATFEVEPAQQVVWVMEIRRHGFNITCEEAAEGLARLGEALREGL